MAGAAGAAGDPEGGVPPLEAADRNAGRVGLDGADVAGPDTGTTLGPECWLPAAGDVSGGVDSGAGAVAVSWSRVSTSTFPGSRL
jgi:hypothetical protein